MIRLNDINKTVIDESKISAYYGYEEEKNYCISFVLNIKLFIDYNSQEARDKDIELLDKLFNVKNIEDKVNAYPHEIDTFDYAMSGIKKAIEPVKVKRLTWDYAKQFECGVEVYLPEGSICKVYYEEDNDRIRLGNEYGYIYNKRLFNALKLKRVE